MKLAAAVRSHMEMFPFLRKEQNRKQARAAQTSADADRECQGPRSTWLTVGVKLILGVGLVSNLCMGVLLYAGWHASRDVGTKTNDLLALNAGLNADLRERITVLQEKYLQIPALLSVDPAAGILEKIKSGYTVTKEEQLEGRSAYGTYFKRRQRRDISKGRFVVLNHDGALLVARGILDETGAFTQKVDLIHLQSSDPGADAQGLKEMITSEMAAADSGEALTAKILSLKSQLADEGLAAEESRTQILYHVDQIRAGEKDLEAYRSSRQTTSMIIAGVTIALNLLVLYAMTWLHVERPLKRLTRVINLINGGRDVEIPYQDRKDKIGVLAGVLQSFKGALQDLKSADLRKAEEQQVIQDLIHTMTDLIEDLRTRSQSMKKASFDLHDLAGNTSDQSDTAASVIQRTEENAQGVATAAGRLQAAVANIHGHVERQNGLVEEISAATGTSMEKIWHLNDASREINEIIKLVKNIAGQTRLLALNARIEASRAGAAGKGFAVVANEVRDLSLQTESANQDIEARIGAIQDACRQITESTEGVETLTHDLSETGTLIYEAVAEQRGISDSIAKTAADTTADARDLSHTLAVVKEAAQETRRLSERVRTHSTDMESSLDSLLTNTREKLGAVGETGTNTSLTVC